MAGYRGISKRLLMVYLVDGLTDEIVEIARIEALDQLKTSFSTDLTGWKREQVKVQLSDCQSFEWYCDLLRFSHYELGADAVSRRIDSRPEDIDHAPDILSRAPRKIVVRESALVHESSLYAWMIRSFLLIVI